MFLTDKLGSLTISPTDDTHSE